MSATAEVKREMRVKMFLVLVAGLCLWLVYGLEKGEAPIVLVNGAALLLVGTILFFKLRHGLPAGRPRGRPHRGRASEAL
jgi:uncharacterized protein with PQ loop repeat